MLVTFLLADEEGLDALANVDPDRDQQAFRRGERIWILQAYLRLARAGYRVRLDSRLPKEGLVIYHVKHRNALMRQWTASHRAALVGVRADNHSSPIADFEILQNDHDVLPGRRFYLPHWPQPGILPRDPARGSTIRRISYRGFTNNIDPRFLDAPFQSWLASQGIDWFLDSVPFAGRDSDHQAVAWHDYREVDLVLAVRPPSRNLHIRKPATKLYNAWFGEAPALLGPEYAYRALRRTDLDYIELDSPEQAIRAITELRRDPARYQAMVANGRERAAEFRPDRIVKLWAELLFVTLPPLLEERRVQRWRGRSLVLKKFWRRFVPFAH